jgi:glycerol-3-phosphate O-acyltransferase/dihydroxyacetone phosphate acyltransferase
LSSLQQEAASDDAEVGLAYKTLPHVEQHDMYGAVFQRLNEGDAIGIFPEGNFVVSLSRSRSNANPPVLPGGSHDRTDLLPLKAGFALMALGAMNANPKLKIKIVPVGLSYFHPHKFRSRAVVEFGSPIDVPKDLVDMYAEGGVKKRDACGKLLEMAHDGLKSVTLRTPDFETLMVCSHVEIRRIRLLSDFLHCNRSFKLDDGYTKLPDNTSRWDKRSS